MAFKNFSYIKYIFVKVLLVLDSILTNKEPVFVKSKSIKENQALSLSNIRILDYFGQ